MSVNKAQFPQSVWDGKAQRVDRHTDSRSESPDHNQIVAEIIAVQDYAKNTLGASAGVNEAETDAAVVTGNPIYIKSNGHIDLAEANHPSTTHAVGFATTDTNPGLSASYVTEGQITRSDWTTIIGTTNLTPGSIYFLSADDPGKMTATAPTAVGEFVVFLGRAISTEIFDIEINNPIRL